MFRLSQQMDFCVECNPDQLLIKRLTLNTNHNIVHSGNKAKVLYNLIYKYTSAKGLVDQDPESIPPPLINRFQQIRTYPAYNIDLLFHSSRNNYLIVLKPKLEQWILNAARVANVNVRRYGLPNDGDHLHSIINTNLEKFERLLDALMGISTHIDVLTQLFSDS